MIKMIITCSSYRALRLQLAALLFNIYKICICSPQPLAVVSIHDQRTPPPLEEAHHCPPCLLLILMGFPDCIPW